MSAERQHPTGNEMRALLESVGVRKPNATLLNKLGEIIGRGEDGMVLRKWRYSDAELRPIIEQIIADLIGLNNSEGTEIFRERLEQVAEKFSLFLREFDRKRDAANRSDSDR